MKHSFWYFLKITFEINLNSVFCDFKKPINCECKMTACRGNVNIKYAINYPVSAIYVFIYIVHS